MNNTNRYYFNIFVVGLINAIYQLVLIKQLHVGRPSYSLSVAINLVIALTLVSLGVGAYLSTFFNKFNQEKLLKILALTCSLSIIPVIIFIFRFLSVFTISTTGIITALTILSLPTILLGMILALIYIPFISKKEIGKLVFYHALGFGIGQIFSIVFLYTVGGNSLFLLFFILPFLLVFRKKIFGILTVIIIFIIITIFSFEQKLEDFRPPTRSQLHLSDSSNDSAFEHVYSGWSPYSKIDLYSNSEGCLAGLYNYARQWLACIDKDKDFEFRNLLYSNLHGEVLLIGAGGGMGVNAFNRTNGITAVEIDPLVVKLMKTQFREYNNDIYNKINVFVGDGRAFLETTPKKYDYIIFEGVDYTVASKYKAFVGVENYLHTQEGLAQAVASLKDNGSLILFFIYNPSVVSKTVASIPNNYFYDIRELRVDSPFLSFRILLVTISKDQDSFNSLLSLYKKYSNNFSDDEILIPFSEKITDDRPFLYLSDKNDINSSFYWLLLTFLMLLLIITPTKNRTFYLYFFFLGIGLIMTELFYINVFRSLFYDYITTFIIISSIFFSGFSLGSYYYQKLIRYRLALPFLMIFSLVLSGFLPWSSNLFWKLVYSVIMIFPVALLLGVFFPLGLLKIKKEQFPVSYLLDSIGAALGFFLIYVLAMLFGFVFSFGVAIALYVLLLLMLSILIK